MCLRLWTCLLFDRSPLDGHALRAADVRQASKVQPVALRVVEEVRAGFVASREVDEGCAVKIMTGAPLLRIEPM